MNGCTRKKDLLTYCFFKEDGKLMADADAGEFWGLFGGFAPLPRKAASVSVRKLDSSVKLLW